MRSKPPLLAIGDLARRTGTTVSALRHYDDVGVISPDARISGKRHFVPESVGRVNFIRRAQRVGFSLDEIRDLLEESISVRHTIVANKLEALHEQRRELDTMITILEEVRDCGCQVVTECPAVPS